MLQELNKIIIKYLLTIVVPLFVGVALYAFLRRNPPNAVAYLNDFLRTKLDLTVPRLPFIEISENLDWIVYNLPDALWAFSLTSFVVLATREDNPRTKLLYLFVSVVIMLVLEITVGTFDWLDLLAMFIGFCASIAIMRMELRN